VKWIDRAGYHPLHLSLRAGDASDTVPTAALAVLNVYLGSIAHCRSFEVQFDDLPLWSALDSPTMLTQRLSLLENLSVTGNECFQLPQTAFFLPLLYTTQNLRSATFIGMPNLPLPQPCRSWVNLRELTLASVQELGNFIYAIRNCQNPERLTTYQIVSGHYAPTITLPQLTCFYASFEPLDLTLFEHMVAPALKELEVLAPNWHAQWQRIVRFLDRSAATLEVFKVHEPDRPRIFNEERFLEALQMPCFHNWNELELNVSIALDTIVFLTLPTPTPTIQTERDVTLAIRDNLTHKGRGPC
jgi:hypothetical protein